MSTQSLSELEKYLAGHCPSVKQLPATYFDEVIGWYEKKNTFTYLHLDFGYGPVKVMSTHTGEAFLRVAVSLLEELTTIMEVAKHDIVQSRAIESEAHALIMSDTLPKLIYLSPEPNGVDEASISVKGEYWSRHAVKHGEYGCVYCKKREGKMTYDGWDFGT